MLKALFVTAAVLLLGISVASVSLRAMEIQKFDKMTVEDQGDYVQLLLRGARAVLIEEGKIDLAEKMRKLFAEVHQGDQMSIGMLQFEENLDRARVFDAERHAKDHSVRRLEVEDAMIMTLKKNGIVLPKSFMSVGNDFKPKHPPNQSAKDTVPDDAKKPPMITQNSDGTFTIQKEPSKEEVKDATKKKGLVIPPQVVIPIVPAPKKGSRT